MSSRSWRMSLCEQVSLYLWKVFHVVQQYLICLKRLPSCNKNLPEDQGKKKPISIFFFLCLCVPTLFLKKSLSLSWFLLSAIQHLPFLLRNGVGCESGEPGGLGNLEWLITWEADAFSFWSCWVISIKPLNERVLPDLFFFFWVTYLCACFWEKQIKILFMYLKNNFKKQTQNKYT